MLYHKCSVQLPHWPNTSSKIRKCWLVYWWPGNEGVASIYKEIQTLNVSNLKGNKLANIRLIKFIKGFKLEWVYRLYYKRSDLIKDQYTIIKTIAIINSVLQVRLYWTEFLNVAQTFKRIWNDGLLHKHILERGNWKLWSKDLILNNRAIS